MTKAIQRIRALCSKNAASEFEDWLSKVQKWPNAAALLNSLAGATDQENLFDHLAPLRYSLIFKYLGFVPSFEPTGKKGPDLLILRASVCAKPRPC